MKAKVIPEKPMGEQHTAVVTIVDRVIDFPNFKHNLPAGLKCKIIFP